MSTATAETTRLLTTAQLADELGVSIGRVQHVILRDRIRPDQVMGRVRGYRVDRLGEFRAALKLGPHPANN